MCISDRHIQFYIKGFSNILGSRWFSITSTLEIHLVDFFSYSIDKHNEHFVGAVIVNMQMLVKLSLTDFQIELKASTDRRN